MVTDVADHFILIVETRDDANSDDWEHLAVVNTFYESAAYAKGDGELEWALADAISAQEPEKRLALHRAGADTPDSPLLRWRIAAITITEESRP
jgi:hypothetical protein